MAIQDTFTDTMRVGLPGMPATTHGYNADTRICETVAGIGFGLAVSQGAGDKGAVLGGAAPVGVTIRDVTLIHDVANLDKYVKPENMGVMVDGDIWVTVVGAVTPATPVTFDAATGQFGAAGTAMPGARYMKGAGAGGLALLRVNMP